MCCYNSAEYLPETLRCLAMQQVSAAVPWEIWRGLFSSAQQEIGILVYSGLFLAEDIETQRTLIDRAGAGVAVRILLGNPDGRSVASRGTEEGIGDAVAAKVRNAIVLYRPLLSVDGIEVRLHDTILYNSIYRADDQLLVNTQVYGEPAHNAPVLHLRRVAGGDMVSTYVGSFDRVWAQATPVE